VYAIGDVGGPPYLAHKGFKEAEVVYDAILGKLSRRDWQAMPSAIFTDPEIAMVGLTEQQAKLKGLAIRVGRFPFSALGRAMALGEKEGFVKVIAHQDRLIGLAAVGPEVSELISAGALALEMGASPEDLSLTVHPHPTLSEAMREAAEHLLGTAVHIMNRYQPRRRAALSSAAAAKPLA
jgi:dihydrolipoamide dehydrogenase